MPEFQLPDLIQKKRDGGPLTDEELEHFIKYGVVNGHATDAQIGAMLMAMYLQGLSDSETVSMTSSMLRSGRVLTWPSEWKGTVVDKHSTGGVGEKTSLILTPALAACGIKVPMITGRGLGHTGGTLDKLEAIPGFRATFTMEEMQDQLQTVGAFIVGPTEDMVPADRVLYATRDVTATVEHKSLIAASIMSKKLAESLDSLVILVAFGTGGFMKTEPEARALGRILNDIGRRHGVQCSCILMHMDDPLGRSVGNALEVRESVRCLNGEGPEDLRDIVCQLGGQLLVSCDHTRSLDEGCEAINKVLKDGTARGKFIDIVTAQGADRTLVEEMFTTDGSNSLPSSREITPIKAESTGYVHRIDAMDCGRFTHMLGAGRTRPGDDVNMGVGLELCVKVGDKLNKGDPWVMVHHDVALTCDQMVLITSAITITNDPPPAERMERIIGVL